MLLATLVLCCCSCLAAGDWAPWADVDNAGKTPLEQDEDAVSLVQRKAAVLTEAHQVPPPKTASAKDRGVFGVKPDSSQQQDNALFGVTAVAEERRLGGVGNSSSENKPHRQRVSLIMALALKASDLAYEACSSKDHLVWLLPILFCVACIIACIWQPWALHLGVPAEKTPVLIQEDISGRVNVETTRQGWRGDLAIFYLLRVPWPVFWLAGAISYLGVILCFAFLYFLDSDGIDVEHPPACFDDAFLLSVQTFSTVGYGSLAPKSNWGHAIMILEVYVSVAYIAVFGGIMFGRVSKPTLTMIFSDSALIKKGKNPQDTGQSLHIRILNERPESSWLDVSASVSAVVKSHGQHRVIPLQLVEERSHVLHVTWTLVHHIDDSSPLVGFSSTDHETSNLVAVIAFLSGTDQVFGSTMHATHTYYTNEILFDRDFVDVLEYASDKLIVHTEKLHDTVEAVH